jgi:hypothetical protein
MRYIDYQFAITDQGILFTDWTEDHLMKLQPGSIAPGDLLEVVQLESGQIYLRKVAPETLEFCAFGTDPVML